MSGFLIEGIFEYTFGDYEIMATIYALAGIAIVYLHWENRKDIIVEPKKERVLTR